MTWGDGINVLGAAPLHLHADLRAQLTGRGRRGRGRRAVSMREHEENQRMAVHVERLMGPLH